MTTRLALTLLASAACLPVGAARVAASTYDAPVGGWYGGIDLGASSQARDDFRFGEVGTDSNDPGFVIDRPSTDADDVGPTLGFAFGRRVSDANGFEFRVRWSEWSERGRFLHDAADYAGGEDPDGMPFNDKNPAFQVVYIDGPGATADSDVNTERLRRGTVGLRLVQALSRLDYDGTAIELGGDWTHVLHSDERSMVQMLVGGQYQSFDQDYRVDIAGTFEHAPDADYDQFSELHESLDEWFLGPRVQFRGRRLMGTSGSAAFEWNAGLALLHRDSDFDGAQDVDGAAGEFEAEAHDTDSGFTARLQAGFGFSWKAGDRVWLGLAYGLDYWSEVASIRNPEITLAEIDGDDRWVADEAARLDEESLLRHLLLFTIAW